MTNMVRIIGFDPGLSRFSAKGDFARSDIKSRDKKQG